MDLRRQLLLLPLASSGGSYVCLEFVFIEESVKMMQERRVLPPARLIRVCFGCPLLVGFQENKK